MYFQWHIIHSREYFTLLLERSKCTLMSTYIFERTKCF